MVGRSAWITRVVAIAAALLSLVSLVALVACTSGPAATPVIRDSSGRPLHAPANYDPSIAGAVACSALILQGTVVRVVGGEPGRTRTTIRVSDWVKPASGPGETVVDTVDIAADGVHRRWLPGQQLRLVVDVDPTVLPNWELTAAQFARYGQAMADAVKIRCPYGR